MSKLVVAFDMDDTLIIPAVATGFDRDTPNYDTIAVYRWVQAQGHTMIIWSGGGAEYARQWECVSILRDLARGAARPPVRPSDGTIRKVLVVGRPADTAAFRIAGVTRFAVASVAGTDADVLAGAAAGCDAAVHLGGVAPGASFAELVREDVLGTWRVFEAARTAGVPRVVYGSTADVFGGWPAGTRITAGTPLRPKDLRAAVKALNEHLGIAFSRRAGLSVVSARLDGGAGDPALLLRALDSPPDGPFVLPELPA